MASANKRSIMTLYSGSNDLESHRSRIVLSEKGIITEVIEVDRYESKAEDLRQINPCNTVPTLVDRDLVLSQSRIIIEYLDERFPHPPLLPVYPISRAKSRLMMFQIEQNWYPLVLSIQNGTDKEAQRARRELQEHITSLAPIFKEYPYFLAEEFSMIDCSLAPLLWRLSSLGLALSKQAQPVLNYAKRLFERSAFRNSLTEVEAELCSETTKK